MSLQELQSQIEAAYSEPIRLEKTKRVREETLQEFLVKFFTDWNNEKNTILVSNGEIQTDTRRRRSLGDIYMICKYYYPSIELKDLIYELYVGLHEYFDTGFRTSHCSLIVKRVWYYNEDQEGEVYGKTKTDEYGNIWNYYLTELGLTGSPDDEDENEGWCYDCEENPCQCDDDY